MRRGTYNEEQLEEQLDARGFMNRFYGRASRRHASPGRCTRSACLFGLGFDTATEIALLVIAGSAAAGGLPFYAILCLPILFAAGMSLLDTIDGAFMNFAYGWAFSKPVRKIFYNITITGLSVAVALFVGSIELVGLLTDRLGINGGVASWFQHFNLNTAGYVIVAMFVVTWGAAILVWRLGRIEERWGESVRTADATSPADA